MSDMLHRPTDEVLARDYLIAAANANGGVVHPKVYANAQTWVRLCSLRATRDPSAWVDSPFRREIVDAARGCLSGETR